MWDWDLILGCAVKLIYSSGVCSSWAQVRMYFESTWQKLLAKTALLFFVSLPQLHIPHRILSYLDHINKDVVKLFNCNCIRIGSAVQKNFIGHHHHFSGAICISI